MRLSQPLLVSYCLPVDRPAESSMAVCRHRASLALMPYQLRPLNHTRAALALARLSASQLLLAPHSPPPLLPLHRSTTSGPVHVPCTHSPHLHASQACPREVLAGSHQQTQACMRPPASCATPQPSTVGSLTGALRFALQLSITRWKPLPLAVAPYKQIDQLCQRTWLAQVELGGCTVFD